jgi:hypothetical protein
LTSGSKRLPWTVVIFFVAVALDQTARAVGVGAAF